MHLSSKQNMQIVRNKYLKHLTKDCKILDVGGRGEKVAKTYQSLFDVDTYYVADIKDGVGVTHVMKGLYELPFKDSYFDLVVSGQTLEHVENPFKLVTEMKRVLKTGGYIVLITPSSGPKHDSRDYWRFMDHAYHAICNDVGLQMVDQWITRNSTDLRSNQWKDNVFVGKNN